MPSPFTPGERELIAAYVSGLNGCRFCFNVHSRVACGLGIDKEVFATLTDDSQPVAARMQPVLRYARKLTETPTLLTPQDAAAVYDAGWDDTALVHAIAVCAYFNMMNRLVEGTGIAGDAESYAIAARRLIEEGYERRPRRTKLEPDAYCATRRTMMRATGLRQSKIAGSRSPLPCMPRLMWTKPSPPALGEVPSPPQTGPGMLTQRLSFGSLPAS
jgi:AhpD family alkylhydroperoxidase